MRQKPLEPSFNMSQADLLLMASTKLGYMRHDAADFASRGVPAARLDAFEQLSQQFANLPTEQEMVQTAAVTTQYKEGVRVRLLTAMQVLMGKVSLLNDSRTPAYKAFGTSGLNSASEADLYAGIRQAVRVSRRTLPNYGAQGITALELDQLSELNEAFLEAVHAQRDAENDGLSTTQTRLGAANAVYEELSYLCEVGKSLYAQTNVSKYEQYVIYDHASAAAVAPPVPVG